MPKKNLNPNNEEYHGQLAGMKPLKPNQCGYHFHVKKTCPEIRGGCGWRRTKGDRTPICPQCGFDMRCERLIVQGYTCCQSHGAGAAKRGRPGGRRPKDFTLLTPRLPHKSLEVYKAALKDDAWLHLKKDAAILESFKHDAIAGISIEDAAAWRMELLSTFKSFRDFQKQAGQVKQQGGDNSDLLLKANEALSKVEQLINEGAQDAQARRETEDIIERKSRLIAKEIKHLEVSHKMIAVDRYMATIDMIYQIMVKRITDHKLIEAIRGDIFEIINEGNTAPIDNSLPFEMPAFEQVT